MRTRWNVLDLFSSVGGFALEPESATEVTVVTPALSGKDPVSEIWSTLMLPTEVPWQKKTLLLRGE